MNEQRKQRFPSRREAGGSRFFSRFRLITLLWAGVAMLTLVRAETVLAESAILIEPFGVRNQNPFIFAYGFPAAGSADLLSAGESGLHLQIDLTNHSKTSERAREHILLDGETYRAALIYKRGWGSGWQFGLELPLIGHHSGFMDNLIENWHDAFGLSNGDRTPWPQNRLLIRYSRDGVVEAELDDGTSGIGDLQLSASRRLLTSERGWQLALNASLELPTGDEDRLLGSGSTDLAIWLSASAPSLIEAWRIGGYLQGGILLPGDGDLLAEQVEDSVWFGSAGLHWHAWSWLMLKAQLDGHGEVYDSDLAQLGKRSLMLTLGGTIPLQSRGAAIDLAFGENLATNSVPDFSINLAYRQRFQW